MEIDTDNDALIDVVAELERARAKFPPFASAHEGYAILLEEVEELKREVFWGPVGLTAGQREFWTEDEVRAERMKLMRAEAVQVAAMALRFIEDVCDREPCVHDWALNVLGDSGGRHSYDYCRRCKITRVSAASASTR